MNVFQRLTFNCALALALILLTWLAPGRSEPGPENGAGLGLETIVSRIDARRQSLESFCARMVQTKTSSLLSRPVTSKATVYFQHRGTVLMRFSQPAGLIVLLKGGSIVFYDTNTGKVRKHYLGTNFLARCFGLGKTLEEVTQLYSIKLLDRCRPGSYTLHLIPKTKAIGKRLDWLKVCFDSKTWLPIQIVTRYANGSQSRMKLKFVTVNEPLPKDVFSIALPEPEPEGGQH